jgi:hypothetical protein
MDDQQGNSRAHHESVSATGSAVKDPVLLKRRQLARALSVSARSIDNWQRQRRIPFIKVSPRCVLFDLASVLRAVKRFEVKAAGE